MANYLISITRLINHSDAYMRTHFRQVEGSIEHLTTGMSLLYSMVKKINTTTVAERTFFEGGSGGGGEGGSGSSVGSESIDKGKGKEDPYTSRAKSVEDPQLRGRNLINLKGINPNNKRSMVLVEKIRLLQKSQGEILGKENRFFIHLMKINITRESRMTLMHLTSLKKSKKK